MTLDEITIPPEDRLSSILRFLNERYNTKINFDNIPKINSLYEQLSNKPLKEGIFEEECNLKDSLILEAIKIYLKEIRPKRSFIKSYKDSLGESND